MVAICNSWTYPKVDPHGGGRGGGGGHGINKGAHYRMKYRGLRAA